MRRLPVIIYLIIAYMFLAWLVPVENQPNWIRDARSAPILKQTGDAIIALLPEDPERAILDKLRNRGGSGEEAPAPEGEEPAGDGEPTDESYKPSEQQGLNQLLDSTRGANQ